MFANLSKCSFGQQKVEYLGYTVFSNSLTMSHAKIKSILVWPVSTTLKQLRGFLVFIGYYRRFIRGYANSCRSFD